MKPEAALRVTIALATGIMMGLSWPLWVEPSALPRVPFVSGFPQSSPAVSWGLFVALLGLIVATVGSHWPRRSLAAWSILLTGLILQDQHRFQPWAYQAIVTAVALAVAGGSGGLILCRIFLIGLYLHSGLSKLDASFLNELGPVFLNAGGRLIGVDPTAWPAWLRTAAILAMPAVEIAVAATLAVRRTRRFGMVGAVLIHLILIALLGPWSLRQSTIVLVWNLSVLAQAVILFGWDDPTTDAAIAPTRRPGFRVGLAAVVVLVALPCVERFGWFDSWPSFALYASHAERLEARIAEVDADALDATARACLFPIPGAPWRRLDLTAWSRAVRGTPAYPQNRANVGLILGLLDRSSTPITFQVILQGRASPIARRRDRQEFVTIADLERRVDRYRLNGRPAVAARSSAP